MKTINRRQTYYIRFILLTGFLVPAFFVMCDELIENPGAKPEVLPDFTRTYGFDFGPEVVLLKSRNTKKKKRKSLSAAARLKALGKKLKQHLQKNKGDNFKYGVQKYTKYTGKRRYGVGFKRKVDDEKVDNLTVHGHGITYERQKLNYNYYMGVDTRNPVDTKEEKEASYIYFGIKVSW